MAMWESLGEWRRSHWKTRTFSVQEIRTALLSLLARRFFRLSMMPRIELRKPQPEYPEPLTPDQPAKQPSNPQNSNQYQVQSSHETMPKTNILQSDVKSNVKNNSNAQALLLNTLAFPVPVSAAAAAFAAGTFRPPPPPPATPFLIVPMTVVRLFAAPDDFC